MSAFNTVEQQKVKKKINPPVCFLKVILFFLQNRKKIGSNWKDVPGAPARKQTAKNALNGGRAKEQKQLEGERARLLSFSHSKHCALCERNKHLLLPKGGQHKHLPSGSSTRALHVPLAPSTHSHPLLRLQMWAAASAEPSPDHARRDEKEPA